MILGACPCGRPACQSTGGHKGAPLRTKPNTQIDFSMTEMTCVLITLNQTNFCGAADRRATIRHAQFAQDVGHVIFYGADRDD